MSSKHPLRRSCAFCRARKIKCSNEPICEACRRQGADCIYDFEAPRPKARAISQDSTRSEPASGRSDDITSAPYRQRSSTCCSSTTGSPVPEEPCAIADGENVAKILEQNFYENFVPHVGSQSSPWHEQITKYNRALQNTQGQQQESAANKPHAKSIKYSGILPMLTQDLVGLVTDHFGTLGCQHVEEGGAKAILSGLASDDSQTMFDNTSVGGSPLSDYGQRQQTQLIDVWFSAHPLSFLVSKTLLLREIRDGTHDEILLAAMLAEANFSIGDEVAMARGHVLLRWATAQLHVRSLRSNHQFQKSAAGISTRIFSALSTAQALILLGWHALCTSQVRRSICYFGLASKIATDIKDQISSTSTPVTSSRINGVDVFDVEKEIVAYLYWTTYSLNLWAFVSMGPGDISGVLPTSLNSAFLPVTEASSVIIQLDLVSDNFSTLQKQKAAIREMWPLANIVSIIAYIYTSNSRGPAKFWPETPQSEQSAQDIGRGLMESIHMLSRQTTEASSKSLVLLVYHTLAIHFLFPELPTGHAGEAFSADLTGRFYSFAQEILRLFSVVSELPEDLFNLTSSLRLVFPRVFGLALDTCARAINELNAKKQMGAVLMDASMMAAYDTNMEALTTKLYAISKDEFLNQGTSLRRVRKQLKLALRFLRGRSSPASSCSGASSPAMTQGSASSAPHTPLHSPSMLGSPAESHMSTATTAVMESSFISPKDATVTPPMSSSKTAMTGGYPFSPLREMHKPEWQTNDEMFHHNMMGGTAMGQNALGIDLQNAWLPQMPGAMDVEMSGPMSDMQWTWPDMTTGVTASAAAASSEVDSLLYYFEQQHQQQTMRT
ncbi:hypothetical protein S40293_07003 [Stachybotrys chartarum IBT 40293]|nr:hypothetical protein S40293_07003 [Stachybotrys chartarum IBT 40293]